MKEENAKNNPVSVGVISLGCDKNRVDSENLLAYLANAGYRITGTAAEADVIIINTCAFTKDAKEEAVAGILEAAAEKKSRGAKVIVTGCLPERYRSEILEGFPEADAAIGINDYEGIDGIIRSCFKGERPAVFSDKAAEASGRILTTPPHYAYLKISDGCDNRCTFCAIPNIRGKYRSRSIESLAAETEGLVLEYGVKELILVAQDTTRYGSDLYGEPSLERLVERLSQTGVEWIRILYAYPEMLDDKLIEYLASNPTVVKYLDVPLQHASNGVLKRMGRRNDKQYAAALIKKLKSKGFAVRTTFITGFPGETEEDFAELLAFINESEIDYAGFFSYSKEEGTPAARLKEQVPARIKAARLKQLQAAGSAVMERRAKAYVGKTLTVIYEGVDFDRGVFYGRSRYQAPEIDSVVYFTADNETVPEVGCFYEVAITGTDGLDLTGVLRKEI
ncbi:MAG: 30S ribosomal protein S12 methylthiotransferase RimO [Clostridiaceae bacterium]|jgi:ribosomal protein S12 methylthiotransferase|nr:30S ribosomal protein S12 methylthiotransferase RimO [Clostridiaceae bacterium]